MRDTGIISRFLNVMKFSAIFQSMFEGVFFEQDRGITFKG